MKTFYTVRDIEDMHAAGAAEIETHDDVVLTDVAREKAIALGMRLVPAERPGEGSVGTDPSPGGGTSGTGTRSGAGSPPAKVPDASASSPSPPRTSSDDVSADMIMKIKAAVVDRLGTDKYDNLLDRIIPQVMARLKK